MSHLLSSTRYVILFSIVICQDILAHSGDVHVNEMMAVFGFQDNPKLRAWMKFISYDMIDNYHPFYNELKRRHPGFICSNHRYLFHWGYNAKPWNNYIEQNVKRYCEQYDLNIESNIRIFKSELVSEQKRRNRILNSKTEELFGFAHGGRDATYANFFCSMAYNIHLLGDYMSDNTILEGLPNINTLIGSFVGDLRRIDKYSCRLIILKITYINKRFSNPQKKADVLMAYLKQSIPSFLKQAEKGNIRRRLEGRGYRFRN